MNGNIVKNDVPADSDPTDEKILTDSTPDDALEAAAGGVGGLRIISVETTNFFLACC